MAKKKNRKKKVIVFFSSCNSVKYHSELLNYIDLPVMDLHGDQKQNKRTATFFDFCSASEGILLCTDVAARGLDIPAVRPAHTAPRSQLSPVHTNNTGQHPPGTYLPGAPH